MNNDETYDELAASYEGQKESAEAWAKAVDDGDVSGLVAEGYGDADSDPMDTACDFEDGFALSVQVERRVRIALTIGGPNIWLVCDVDDDGTVESVLFDAYWGGTHFDRRVPPGHPLYRLAERYCETAVLA